MLIQQRWRLVLDAWPSSGVLRLPLSPLIGWPRRVFDAAGVPTVLAAGLVAPDPGHMIRRSSPSRCRCRSPAVPPPGIEIEIDVGFGPGRPTCRRAAPAVLHLAARWHEHRLRPLHGAAARDARRRAGADPALPPREDLTMASRNPIGAMRRRLSIEAPSETADGAGGVIRSFVTVASVWAQVTFEGGSERSRAGRPEQAGTYLVILRWRAGLDAGMRFVDGAQVQEILAPAIRMATAAGSSVAASRSRLNLRDSSGLAAAVHIPIPSLEKVIHP